MADRGMLPPVAWPDLVAGQPYYRPAEREMAAGRVVKTKWPELVNQPYLRAANKIKEDRPDTEIYIVELAPAQELPYGWPSDYTRVCVKINTRTMTVYGGDPKYPCPQCG